MHTENRIEIEGPAERIFELAADIGSWPRWLPHYRWVRVYEDDGRRKTAEMAALRNRFPVKWKTIQEVFPNEGRITFRHIGGVTRGMWVEWTITEHNRRSHVIIAHELEYPVPIVGTLFANLVVGRVFIHHIASQTLAHMKRRVEAEAGRAMPGAR